MNNVEEQFTFFWKNSFSQWHRSKFKVDDVEYCTCEQFMMAEKARFFGDKDTLKKIMDSTSPKEQKALGREVKNFDEGKWDAVARDIVYKGNYAKFTQDKSLKDKLLATKGTTLAEVSEFDEKWGIGRTAEDPLSKDRKTWKGKNWLGETLTKVRDDILKESK